LLKLRLGFHGLLAARARTANAADRRVLRQRLKVGQAPRDGAPAAAHDSGDIHYPPMAQLRRFHGGVTPLIFFRQGREKLFHPSFDRLVILLLKRKGHRCPSCQRARLALDFPAWPHGQEESICQFPAKRDNHFFAVP
jgi:hypothetical protein